MKRTHMWQRDCAHARLVTRDGEIEITVSVTRSHVRTYVRLYELRAGCTTRWARSRSPNYRNLVVKKMQNSHTCMSNVSNGVTRNIEGAGYNFLICTYIML